MSISLSNCRVYSASTYYTLARGPVLEVRFTYNVPSPTSDVNSCRSYVMNPTRRVSPLPSTPVRVPHLRTTSPSPSSATPPSLIALPLPIFCSVQCPGDLILKSYDLARALRAHPITLIGGFQSPIEKEFLELLLRQPATPARQRRAPVAIRHSLPCPRPRIHAHPPSLARSPRRRPPSAPLHLPRQPPPSHRRLRGPPQRLRRLPRRPHPHPSRRTGQQDGSPLPASRPSPRPSPSTPSPPPTTPTSSPSALRPSPRTTHPPSCPPEPRRVPNQSLFPHSRPGLPAPVPLHRPQAAFRAQGLRSRKAPLCPAAVFILRRQGVRPTAPCSPTYRLKPLATDHCGSGY